MREASVVLFCHDKNQTYFWIEWTSRSCTTSNRTGVLHHAMFFPTFKESKVSLPIFRCMSGFVILPRLARSNGVVKSSSRIQNGLESFVQKRDAKLAGAYLITHSVRRHKVSRNYRVCSWHKRGQVSERSFLCRCAELKLLPTSYRLTTSKDREPRTSLLLERYTRGAKKVE